MGAAAKVDQEFQVIQMPASLEKDALAELERNSKGWLLEPVTLHIFDFTLTTSIHPATYHFFANYKRQLSGNAKFLASIGLRESLHRELTSAGMGAALHPVSSIEKAREEFLPTKRVVPKLDATILDYFVQGTVIALKQANVEITPGKPTLKTENQPNIAIAGLLSFNSTALPGSIALCFPKEVFLKVYESMVGEKHTEISEEIQDAAAELLNILYGHAKTKLIIKNIPVDRAIPVVMVGERLRTQMGDKGTSMILPFSSPVGNFHIEIGIFKKT